VRTHWRTGTVGRTASTRLAARSAMRRPPQLAHTARLAGERHEPLERAVVTPNPREPPVELPTPEEVAELAAIGCDHRGNEAAVTGCPTFMCNPTRNAAFHNTAPLVGGVE
jgi:hypothetical protein